METEKVVETVQNLELEKDSKTKTENETKLQKCDYILRNENTSSESEFYGNAQKYWSEVPATVDGMLGGLGYISAIDIQGSNAFLKDLKNIGKKRALDCGAGIGRVTKYLLLPKFSCVDLVEQDKSFAEKSRSYCSGTVGNVKKNEIGSIYNVGLQEFIPDENKYDLIWSQWVLGYLTDEDLSKFFQRVKKGLTKNGYFVMKENVTSTREIDFDEQDSSVTRPLKLYETFLKDSGFRIVRTLRQQSFPKGLYPVYMIACKPIPDTC